MTPRHPDLDELADLDAGLLDQDTARAVRAAAEADPAAQEVLAALAATRASLAALPDPAVPADVAARWSAALREATRGEATRGEAAPGEAAGAEAATPAAPAPDAPAPALTPLQEGPPPGPAAGRRRRREPRRRATTPPGSRPPRGTRRALVRRPAVLAGAALLVVLALAALFGRGRDEVTVDGATLVHRGLQSRGLHDTGAFEDPARRASCLAAVRPPGVAAAAPLLGGRQVTFEGRDGVLLLLGTGRIGQFDVVVVDPSCSALLAARRIGG